VTRDTTVTYATFGHSGGNESGVGYKIVQDNGKRTGGYSSFAVKDNYHYYWLWDVNDLAQVRAGTMKPHEVRPYEYGIFRTPFAGSSHRLGGGAFDASTGRIYLTAQKADRKQGRFAKGQGRITRRANLTRLKKVIWLLESPLQSSLS